jgi:mRNA-degrading endonuclease RelE of RelBE toxin-antitoxin system
MLQNRFAANRPNPAFELTRYGMARPQYRLRVEEVRVFYDVSGPAVEVLAIVPKPEAESWLAQFGRPR